MTRAKQCIGLRLVIIHCCVVSPCLSVCQRNNTDVRYRLYLHETFVSTCGFFLAYYCLQIYLGFVGSYMNTGVHVNTCVWKFYWHRVMIHGSGIRVLTDNSVKPRSTHVWCYRTLCLRVTAVPFRQIFFHCVPEGGFQSWSFCCNFFFLSICFFGTEY